MTNTKLKIGIVILIMGIITISGWLIWNNFEKTEKGIVTTSLPSSNYISISHHQEDNNEVLYFDVDFQDYSNSIKSEDSQKSKGSVVDFLVSPEFDFTPGFSFVEIRSGNSCMGECRAQFLYLIINISLPVNSDLTFELLEFEEEKIEEELNIEPCFLYATFSKECLDYKQSGSFPEISIVSHVKLGSRPYYPKTVAYMEFPLSRHNPSTRETYFIKNAKIKASYKLNKDDMLMLDLKNEPREINTLKFNLSYGVTNPSAIEIKNLKIKADLDNRAMISFSKEFNISGHETKTVSFLVDNLWHQRSIIIHSYIVKDSKIIATMPREWIQSSLVP